MPTDTFPRLQKLLSDRLGVDIAKVVPEASFVDDLGADSLDTVEVVMAAEEEFLIEIAEEDIEQVATVQELVNAINRKRGDG